MKKLFTLLILWSLAMQSADCKKTPNVLTAFVPRSQERHRPQQLAGLCDSTYILDAGPFYGTASITGSYAQTFKAHDIAQAFFGPALFCSDNHNPYIKIQGNAYVGANRDNKALFADYFYLPQDYESTIVFNPIIKNYSVDIDLYFGLNAIHDGLYLRFHSPLVHTQWDMHMREHSITPGSLDHPAGYFTPNITPVTTLLSRFTDYSSGHSPARGSLVQQTANIDTNGFDNESDQIFTIAFDPLHYSKLACSALTKTRLSDIRIEMGKIIAEEENYSFGVHLELLIPTGTRKKSDFLFQPIIGNGDHWEFGGGLQGHYQWYTSRKTNAAASVYGDLNITHLFKTNQQRTFDLKNKSLSRYMLAAHFTPAVVGLFAPEPIIPSAQFANRYTPVANITTVDVSVSADIQIDASAYIHYQKNRWDFDCGYNIWYRSKEQIKCQPTATCCHESLSVCDPQNKNRWALKGDAAMYGFNFDDDEGLLSVVPLSATENNATIYQGTHETPLTCSVRNSAVDNPAVAQPNPITTNSMLPCPFLGTTINTSQEPVFVTCSDLAIKGIRGLSHTIFAHTSYMGQWRDYSPYAGLGASAELGMHNRNNTLFAISQWTVWVKVGLAFG